ncbi:hypothetical protein [Escherichia phage vB_EcoM_EP57]|nr:hypothetical protein [Escherichia phage vB_EcoM_EP57]
MAKMLAIDDVVTITTSIPCPPMPCPYCGGSGYVMADVQNHGLYPNRVRGEIL